jgi:hypothetical protein
LIIGIPIVSKYPGLTIRNSDAGDFAVGAGPPAGSKHEPEILSVNGRK